MGISTFGKLPRPRGRSLAILAILALCVTTAAVAVAAESPAPRKSAAKRSEGDGTTLARSVRALRSQNPLKAIAAGASLKKSNHDTNRNPILRQSRVLAVAVDWPYTYSVVLKKPIADGSNYNARKMATSLVRRNVVSGARQVVFRTRRALPLVLRAGGGRAFLWLIDSRSENSIATKIVAFEHESPTPVTIADDTASTPKGSPNQDICGRISSLSGAGPAGEAIVWRSTSTCTTDRHYTYDLETVAIARDGSTRVLNPLPNAGGMFYGRAQLVGDRLVESGLMAGTISSIDTTTGAGTRLIDAGGQNSASLAPDGSVVIGPSYGYSEDAYYYDEYDYDDSAKDPAIFFPQSNADSPATVADTGYRTMAMRYCGQQLYEVRLLRSQSYQEVAFESAIFDGLPAVAKFKIIARDVAATSPREIAVTDELWVRALGCDGESLVLATDLRTGADAVRFGP